jgi:hypothetical protein
VYGAPDGDTPSAEAFELLASGNAETTMDARAATQPSHRPANPLNVDSSDMPGQRPYEGPLVELRLVRLVVFANFGGQLTNPGYPRFRF